MAGPGVQAEELLVILRGLVSEVPHQRALTADQVTDCVGSYSEADGRVLAGVLAVAACSEADATALEAQLNAIIQLGSLADEGSVSYVKELEGRPLPGILSEYIHDILHE
ncbi:hypothetical protein ACFVHW_04640 [Streptomyces sp. NPDC127110]|uniref:hypothetical protein n=1 Tax=Streptomyces sp. NPDC127110 TaxID=3345362 RepID=UPI00363F488D